MPREVWQAYDCPLSGVDFDLTGEQMVHQGQRFRCAGCGQEHMAGVHVRVETFEEVDGSTFFPGLPATADDLQRFREG